MDTTFLSWSRDNIPPSYEPITWQDRLERIPEDYDPPSNWTPDPTKPDYHDIEAMRAWTEKKQAERGDDLDWLLTATIF